jgi:hypothetical protein
LAQPVPFLLLARRLAFLPFPRHFSRCGANLRGKHPCLKHYDHCRSHTCTWQCSEHACYTQCVTWPNTVLHGERPAILPKCVASRKLWRCSPAGGYPSVAVHAEDLLPSLMAHHMAKDIQHWGLCLLSWLVLQNKGHLSAHQFSTCNHRTVAQVCRLSST